MEEMLIAMIATGIAIKADRAIIFRAGGDLATELKKEEWEAEKRGLSEER